MNKNKLQLIFSALFILFISSSALAQTTKMSLSDKLKLMDADENYQKEYWDAAYGLYRDLHIKYPANASISYKAGKVSYILKKYDEALTFLTKAAEAGKIKGVKDLEFWLGQAQHKEGMLDEALANYQKYRATLKGKAQTTDIVNDYIYQVELAKKLISIPVNVKITNMGEVINSEYIESNPSVTADGKVMIFTTCRPENTGGLKDPTFGVYYQDIWISEKDSVTGLWGEAEIVKTINTKEHDANTSISADGNVIYIYKSVNGGDIFYSKKRKNGDWKVPELVKGKVNTTFFETSACVTADKKQMFLVSERNGKGAQGNGDIWMTKKTGSFEYEEAVNMGPVINTIDDEVSVFVHPDGKTIFFSSNGKNSIGGYDIFKSELKDGKWTAPVNLGYPINTLGDEKQFCLTADGQKAYVTSKREGGRGDFDIYEIDLANYKVPDPDGKNEGSNTIMAGSVSILKGKVLDAREGTPVETIVRIEDENGQLVDELETSESGEFLIIIDGGKNYKIVVKQDEYKTYEETIFIPKTEGKAETVVKAIFMEDGD